MPTWSQRLSICTALWLAGCAATPAEIALPRTQSAELASGDGLPYRLYVSLPRDYAQRANVRFPVVYLLDAEFSFAMVRNLVQHFSDRSDLPEMIVVAIAYPGGIEGEGWLRRYRTNRTRDYTPTYSANGYPGGIQDVSGGAARFLSFVEKQAVPYVDQHYRTVDGDRTIVGHSYGGLFSMYAMATRPTLFSRAVLISPSLWYDQRFIFRYLDSQREALKGFSTRVFLAAGSREDVHSEGDIAGDVERLGQALAALAPSDRQVQWHVFDGESHNSVFAAAVTRGLLTVFSGAAPTAAK